MIGISCYKLKHLNKGDEAAGIGTLVDPVLSEVNRSKPFQLGKAEAILCTRVIPARLPNWAGFLALEPEVEIQIPKVASTGALLILKIDESI